MTCVGRALQTYPPLGSPGRSGSRMTKKGFSLWQPRGRVWPHSSSPLWYACESRLRVLSLGRPFSTATGDGLLRSNGLGSTGMVTKIVSIDTSRGLRHVHRISRSTSSVAREAIDESRDVRRLALLKATQRSPTSREVPIAKTLSTMSRQSKPGRARRAATTS